MISSTSPISSLDYPANAYLATNEELYAELLADLQRLKAQSTDDDLLQRISNLSGHAAVFHPGRFSDGRLESMALEVGARVRCSRRSGSTALPKSSGRQRRVLHVATHVVPIAGHARMLDLWVRNDPTSSHSLVITNQANRDFPPWLLESVRNSGGAVVDISGERSLVGKAGALRSAAQEGADAVILHHDGYDITPNVAFGDAPLPPVLVLNHADHQFWLGSSVADLCINLRSAAAPHTLSRRYIDANVTLPIPLKEREIRDADRVFARRSLGIPSEQIVILSVGRQEKYYPCASYDFTRTASAILNRQPKAHIYVVGPTRESMAGLVDLHDRLHFVGPQPDPYLFHALADIYIESFPFGSQTALLEAAMSALPIVPSYSPLFSLLVANDDDLIDLLPNPPTEEAYITQVLELTENAQLRRSIGEVLRGRVVLNHVGNGWTSRLSQVYSAAQSRQHRPREIPATSADLNSTEDISLSYWQVVADGKSKSVTPVPATKEAVLGHAAYVFRVAGKISRARVYAMRRLATSPLEVSSWRLFFVCLLGTAPERIRKLRDSLARRVRVSSKKT